MRTVHAFGLGAAMLLAGCSTQRPYTYTTPSGQVISSGTRVRNPSDVALETNVRAEMSRYGDLAAVSPNVQVYAQNGTVTLTGSVPSERDRQMIDAMVRNSSGVAAVNDQLQVTYPPTSAEGQPPQVYSGGGAPVITPPPPPPVAGQGQYPDFRVLASTPGDEATAASIVEHLRREGIPPAWLQTADINVREGNVYITGSVDTLPQHQAIVAAVQRAQGVKAVYDQLQNR